MYVITVCNERSPVSVLSRPIAFSASGDIWCASCLHKVVRKLNDAMFYMSLRRLEGVRIIMSLGTGNQDSSSSEGERQGNVTRRETADEVWTVH